MGMTWICVVGIELSARTQMALLLTELVVLVLFSVVAIFKVYGNDIHGRSTRRCRGSPDAFRGVSALAEGCSPRCSSTGAGTPRSSVNEECENANSTPGLAGVLSTVILVAIFVVVAIAAQAVKGADFLTEQLRRRAVGDRPPRLRRLGLRSASP